MKNASCIELHPVSQRVQVQVDVKLLGESNQTLELQEQSTRLTIIPQVQACE